MITLSIEGKRGCGYRSAGKRDYSIYLMGKGFQEVCERLPWPLVPCPCCGNEITHFRGLGWIAPREYFHPHKAPKCNPDFPHTHEKCIVCNPKLAPEKSGLIWVGKQFYATTEEFLTESAALGVSRKLPQLPREAIKLLNEGRLWVYLAHMAAINRPPKEFGDVPTVVPGIFSVFRVTSVDIVVNTMDEEELPDEAVKLAASLGENARFVKVRQASQKGLGL